MKKQLANYGMVLVLIALCLLFSLLTIQNESGTGSGVAKSIASRIEAKYSQESALLIVGEARKDSGDFAELVAGDLRNSGYSNVSLVVGTPRDLKLALDQLSSEGKNLKAIVASGDSAKWGVTSKLAATYPRFADSEIMVPSGKMRSVFLSPSNLEAVISRVVAIAVVAVGMTLVILTGGIDLSVGSLIALAAVVGALIISKMGGGSASGFVVFLGFTGAILTCGFVGMLSGWLVAQFKVAPFITTLAFMMMARGFAKKITGGFTIESLPDAMTWLGQGKTLGIPNTILILLILYIIAHLFMSQTRFGRYIYAVGGNEESARLSGVPVKSVIIFVYLVCGLCAGLGGCIQASQIKVGTPNIGVMFELYVIAAVVVGGTSLSGGSGRVIGTLIGALIIGVIQNGMNLMGLKQFTQDIVLGAVILFAVLLDKARAGGGLGAFRKLGFARQAGS
ncbi:MAG: ABC transporter permease [Verrucomicrobiales bacterium]|nr:ABC transporter permease [Verrucomicrobiales bacterium]